MMIAAPTDRIGAAMCRLADLRRQATSIGTDCPPVVDDALAAVQELIGELKNAIEEVRQAEEQKVYWHSSAERARHEYEEMLALIPLPFLRTDSRGTILNLNERAARLLNLSRQRAIGKTLSLFIAADRDSFVTRLAGIIPSNRVEEWPLQIRPREKQRVRVTATVGASTFNNNDETVTWLLAPIADQDSGQSSSKRARGKTVASLNVIQIGEPAFFVPVRGKEKHARSALTTEAGSAHSRRSSPQAGQQQ